MKKATRGRPPAGKADNQLKNTQVEAAVSRDEVRKPKRPERVPMVAGLKLDYRNKKEGWHYCWIQDQDGRIEGALQAYYEFVLEDGEKVVRASGAYPLFLMRLENKYWKEDQDLKYKQTVAKIQGEQTLEPGEYIPGAQDGRKHVLERDDYDPLA